MARSVWSVERAKFNDLAQATRPHDLIVLGTSRSLHGIDPTHFGALAEAPYNFAERGTNARYYLTWYALYRHYNPSPRVALIELNWTTLSDQLDRMLENDSEYLPLDQFLGDLLDRSFHPKMMLLNRLALIKEREDLVQRALNGPAPVDFGRVHYAEGYYPFPSGRFNATHASAEPAALKPERLAQLAALIQRLKAERVRVICFQTPEYRPLSLDRSRENRFLAGLCRHWQVPWLDYNLARPSALNEDKRAFVDWSHLNYPGSQRFSSRLASDLAAWLPAKSRPHR